MVLHHITVYEWVNSDPLHGKRSPSHLPPKNDIPVVWFKDGAVVGMTTREQKLSLPSGLCFVKTA